MIWLPRKREANLSPGQVYCMAWAYCHWGHCLLLRGCRVLARSSTRV